MELKAQLQVVKNIDGCQFARYTDGTYEIIIYKRSHRSILFLGFDVYHEWLQFALDCGDAQLKGNALLLKKCTIKVINRAL